MVSIFCVDLIESCVWRLLGGIMNVMQFPNNAMFFATYAANGFRCEFRCHLRCKVWLVRVLLILLVFIMTPSRTKATNGVAVTEFVVNYAYHRHRSELFACSRSIVRQNSCLIHISSYDAPSAGIRSIKYYFSWWGANQWSNKVWTLGLSNLWEADKLFGTKNFCPLKDYLILKRNALAKSQEGQFAFVVIALNVSTKWFIDLVKVKVLRSSKKLIEFGERMPFMTAI